MLLNNPSRNLPLLSPIHQLFLIINKIIILTFPITTHLIIPTEPSPSSVIGNSVTGNNPTNQNNYHNPSSYDNNKLLANGVAPADSPDLETYSDSEYYQLAAEYEDNLRASFAAEEEEAIENGEQSENGDDEHANQQQHHKKKEEESYEEMASRLKCDNPWFWNAPRCTWIDVKAKHVISRTNRNAETSAWFLGSTIGFLVVWLCAFYCCYQLKLKNRQKMQLLREKYAPGRIELPNGKIAQYQPTEEENKAYEELVKAIIIQEMSLI